MTLERIINSNLTEKTIQKSKLKSYDVFLLQYARVIDNIDMYLGPLTEISKISNSEIITVAGALATLSKGALKIPFITMYLSRTHNYSALYDWMPKEIFSYVVPMGGFIDILRNYEKVTFESYGLKPYSNIPKISKK